VALLAGGGVVASLVLAGGAAALSLRHVDRQLLAERRALAAGVAGNVERTIRLHLATLSRLGADTAAARSDLRAAFVQSRDLSGVFLLDADGEPSAEEPAGLLRAGTLPRPEVAAAHRGDRPTVTDVQADSRAYLLAPLHDRDGRLAGTAGGVIDPRAAAWSGLLGPGPTEAGGSIDLVDGRGLVMASTDGARVLQGTGALAEMRIAAPVGGSAWQVVLRPPQPEANPLRALSGRLAMLGLAALAVALLFAWGAARSVTEPLDALSRAAERMARGAIDTPIPALGDDQVGQLARTFETMRVALARSLESTSRARDELEHRVEERTQELRRLYLELSQRDAVRGRLLRKVIGAQEEERRRIARELHDQTCQALALLAMRCEGARGIRSPRERDAALGDAHALAARALDDVHRMIVDLRPAMLDDLGLLPAIRGLAAHHLEPFGVSVRCEFGELEPRLSPETETALFRAAQEALVNVARHAQAQNVLVQASRAGDALEIEIEDDGRGFEPEGLGTAEPGGRGLGLLGIRERMELLGGSAGIDSSPGHGTRIVLRVPLPASSGPEAPAHA
jgi:signal transduction histidine kinase